MQHLPWYITGLGAALMWGIHYPLVEHALRKVSLAAVLLLTALPILAVAVIYRHNLARDLVLLGELDWRARLPIFALALTSLGGTVLLFTTIGNKNATLASLIEITYPLFIVLFTWLLFRQVHLTPAVAAGGALIMLGAALIIASHY
ncbi:EamA family transporter [Ectothiorhodospiraceae bacterium 2226]|nr:EamA family transporter [Ectothiorhodospiraceae bacterium 2226]